VVDDTTHVVDDVPNKIDLHIDEPTMTLVDSDILWWSTFVHDYKRTTKRTTTTSPIVKMLRVRYRV
jgi:hypothetical protein